MHAVVLHAQIADAGTLALTLLHRQQVFGAARLDATQLVQLGVKTFGDDAAVSDIDSRLRLNRLLQAIEYARGRLQLVGNLLQQHRLIAHGIQYAQQLRTQALCLVQRAQQAGQLTRAALAQRQPRADALHVAGAMQGGAQVTQALLAQQRDGIEPLLRLQAIALLLQHPAAQCPAAHAALAAIEQAEQCRTRLATQRERQLQVALRRQWQLHQAVITLHLQMVQMRHGAALGMFGVSQQRGGGGMRLHHFVGLPGIQVGRLQLLGQLAQAQAAVKGKRRTLGNDEALHGTVLLPLRQLLLQRLAGIGAVQHFHRLDAADPLRQLVRRAFGQAHAALRQTHPGQADAAVAADARRHLQRQQHGFGLVAQQLGFGQRARRHHAHHLALYRPLGRTNLADLLANRYRFAHLDQLGQVVVQRMHRHASHRNRLPSRLAAIRQRDAEQARGLDRVVVEQLVEIPHAVEQQRGREVHFHRKILRHHGRVAG